MSATDEPPTGAIAEATPPFEDAACACSGCASENEPLTSRPVALLLGSWTVSAALPAVETTFAVVVAV